MAFDDDDVPLAVPGPFGPVWLLAPLLRGGGGAVFVGTMDGARDGELVVVKRLAAGLRVDPGEVLASAGYLRSKVLPYVAAVVDAGASDGMVWIASRYHEGADLDVILRRGARDEGVAEPVAIAIVADLLRGLAGLHGLGLVHRDVAAQNVVVGVVGRTLLVDIDLVVPFGTAATDHVPGSAAYMSPEQATGLPVDARADLVGVGVVLYELLTGDAYFGDLGLDDIWRLARTGGYRPRRISTVREPLCAFIARCTAADPGNRYPSAEAALQALLAVGVAASAADVAAVVKERAGERLATLRALIERGRAAPRPERPSPGVDAASAALLRGVVEMRAGVVTDPLRAPARPATNPSASVMRPRSRQSWRAVVGVVAVLVVLAAVLAVRAS